MAKSRFPSSDLAQNAPNRVLTSIPGSKIATSSKIVLKIVLILSDLVSVSKPVYTIYIYIYYLILIIYQLIITTTTMMVVDPFDHNSTKDKKR